MSGAFDIVVIGGGIAGAAAAANLADGARVLLLEREPQPGYHATGRSAAVFSEIYGSAPIRALTRASRGFFFEPPAGFAATSLVSPRGALYVANAAQQDVLQRFADLADVAAATRRVDVREAICRVPCLREDYVAAGLYEPGACDLDVHTLHQGYLRRLRECGGSVVCNAGVHALARAGSGWKIASGAGEFSAATLVNAAGAWVDEVAAMAGAAPIGIRPLRRTAFLVEAPIGTNTSSWALTIDIGEQFYFKPDTSDRLLLSPADEGPSAPCDAWPLDLDVAVAVARVERATTLCIRRVQQKWAGLRSFVADRNPVIGYDLHAPDFFWVGALGGYGIQTAPAVGRLAAALLRRQPVPTDLLELGLDPAAISPQRLRNRTNQEFGTR